MSVGSDAHFERMLKDFIDRVAGHSSSVFGFKFSKHNDPFRDRMTDMTTLAKKCKSTVIPGLRYRNAMAMIEWLCMAFGFEKQAVYAGPDGVVMHSQLRICCRSHLKMYDS